MYEFETESGTIYRVHNGRISRVGEPTWAVPPIVNEPVRFTVAPTIGARCVFTTRQDRFTTSPVVFIERDPEFADALNNHAELVGA